jgi:hypothetical protein
LPAQENGITDNYTGPRISKLNQTFIIHDAIVWRIHDEKKEVIGLPTLFWLNNSEKPGWFNTTV